MPQTFFRIGPTGNSSFDADEVAAAQAYQVVSNAPRHRYYRDMYISALKNGLLLIAKMLAGKLNDLGNPPAPYYTATSATVQSGGTGTYVVGDTLSSTGGSREQAATWTVATVSTGAVATVTPLVTGIYYNVPANAVATTGGSGNSDATLNITWERHVPFPS